MMLTRKEHHRNEFPKGPVAEIRPIREYLPAVEKYPPGA